MHSIMPLCPEHSRPFIEKLEIRGGGGGGRNTMPVHCLKSRRKQEILQYSNVKKY